MSAPAPLEQNPSKLSTDSGPLQVGPTGAWQHKQKAWIPNPDDPIDHPHRTLILLFDGTGDQYDDDNSNIVQLCSLLKKDDPSKQMIYYQTGIGTTSSADAKSAFIRAASQTADMMFATTIGHHIRDGYEFLMQNYTAGDIICIFGFSRGAYTARALAGMIQKVGLLPAWNKQQIPFAYHMYSRQDDESLRLCRGFKETFSIDVKIEFVGVWDTVASVGIIPKYLPFVMSNNSIRYFRHALALDEHRAKFHSSYYKQSRDEDEHPPPSEPDVQEPNTPHLRTETDATLTGGKLVSSPPVSSAAHKTEFGLQPSSAKKLRPKRSREFSQAYLFENEINRTSGQKTDSLEVWFAGAHCDVGGGSVQNHTRNSLARIPLRWMIRECFRARTGIIFDAQALRDQIGMDVDLEAMRVMEPPQRLTADAAIKAQATLNAEAASMNDALLRYRLRPQDPAPGFFTSAVMGIASTVTAPVRWVVSGLGSLVGFDEKKGTGKIQLSTLDAPPREPFRGEAMEELLDSLSPMYDQLHLAPSWWVLEWLPLRAKKEGAIYTSSDNTDDYTWLVNRGLGRKVFKHVVFRGIKVHRSVLTRLEALDHRGEEGTYVPYIRPNIVAHDRDDAHGIHEHRLHFRRMTHDEWISQRVPGLEDKWFEWIEV